MNLRSVTTVAATCAMFGCASPSVATPLDELIGFTDPYWCEQSADFDALQDSLLRWEETRDGYRPILQSPVVPEYFQAQTGEPKLKVDGRNYRVTLPMRGTWRGLPVRALVILGIVESEQGFELVFDATHAQVLQAANEAGFRIPDSGSEYRDDVNGVMGMNVAVIETGGGRVALSCFPG